MKPVLKSIFLLDADSIFQDFEPEIPHNFHVSASLTIGDAEKVGGDDYSLGICTPIWLDHHIQNMGPLIGRHLLIVNRFDANEVRATVEKIISESARESRAETNSVLTRFFAWEYEDYQL